MAENLQDLIDLLEQQILKVDLSSISAVEIIMGNPEHCIQLLQLLQEITIMMDEDAGEDNEDDDDDGDMGEDGIDDEADVEQAFREQQMMSGKAQKTPTQMAPGGLRPGKKGKTTNANEPEKPAVTANNNDKMSKPVTGDPNKGKTKMAL